MGKWHEAEEHGRSELVHWDHRTLTGDMRDILKFQNEPMSKKWILVLDRQSTGIVHSLWAEGKKNMPIREPHNICNICAYAAEVPILLITQNTFCNLEAEILGLSILKDKQEGKKTWILAQRK